MTSKLRSEEDLAAEKRAIERALETTGYHIERAALALGISRTTMRKRMKEHGLPPGKPGPARKVIGEL